MVKKPIGLGFTINFSEMHGSGIPIELISEEPRLAGERIKA